MMNGLKRAVKCQNLDAKKSFGWFWGTMLLVDILSYVLNRFYSNIFDGFAFGINLTDGTNFKATSIAGANLWPIVIFFIVYSYVTYYEFFPIALSFSVTRKDFFKSVVLDNIKVTSIFATIQSILMKLDRYAIRSLNKTPIVDFKIFNTETDNIIIMIFSLFIAFIAITSFCNFLAAINYKYGYKVWIVIGVISTFTAMFMGSTFLSIVDWVFTTRVNIMQFFILILLTALMYVIGNFMTRSINIKSKLG